MPSGAAANDDTNKVKVGTINLPLNIQCEYTKEDLSQALHVDLHNVQLFF